MKKLLYLVLVMALGLFGCGTSAQPPQGKLVYCSYSCTGVAGLGKDFCELVADPGEEPKVVVALHLDNRFGDPEIRKEFPVTAEVVDSLQTLLSGAEVYRLNGYNVDEEMTGGHIYRIYQEYDSGEKINARWYGHNIQPEAWAAYAMIERFFEPWRAQADTPEQP